MLQVDYVDLLQVPCVLVQFCVRVFVRVRVLVCVCISLSLFLSLFLRLKYPVY